MSLPKTIEVVRGVSKEADDLYAVQIEAYDAETNVFVCDFTRYCNSEYARKAYLKKGMIEYV